MIKSWLEITTNEQGQAIVISNMFDFNATVIRNEVWYRGEPEELSQLYKNLNDSSSSFWTKATHDVRKIHTGLPSLIVDTLTQIVVRDMDNIECDTRKVELDKIIEDNNFTKLVSNALSLALYKGDGAFKISFDKSVSNEPIIEFYPADRVDFIFKRGRYCETIFSNPIRHKGITFIHNEIYGYGYIKNELIDTRNNKKVHMNTLEELADIDDYIFAGYEEDENENVKTKGSLNMAIPFYVYKNAKYENRGKSIFDSKVSSFDALDEVVSQWLDAVRHGRATKYIPESMIPRDKTSGELLKPNAFKHDFIKVKKGSMEEGDNGKIEVTQPTIPSTNYLESYSTYLDLCLQGLISPSTLGIDTKKLDNAEAQREKEKTTLYTRNRLIQALQDTIPDVLETALKALDVFNKKQPSDEPLEITVNFGEYANPSFESVVETMGKAKTSQIMSTKKIVDELYGDSMEDEDKEEEVKRIIDEYGTNFTVDEPGLIDDVNALNGGNPNDSTNTNK
ncbi:MAG: capsid protein [Breznakia sp.]